MMENIRFPIAKPTIEEVLDEFLESQRKRLKPRTVQRYEEIIQLFEHSLNGYAYQCLSKAESKLFDELYEADGDAHREFVQIFGPEKIAENVDEFLGYFMPRKVMCGKELLRSAGTVMKKLGKWLVERGYAEGQDSEHMVELGSEAYSELPAAEELGAMLYEHAQQNIGGDWTDEIDDYFTVERVERDKIWLSALGGEDIVLSLPKRITEKCKVGWQINLFVGKTKKGWRIIEVGQVYAM